MKKIKVLALILCVVLAFGMFAGCGKTATPAPAAAPAAEPAAAPAAEPAPEQKEEPVDDTVYTLIYASTNAEGSTVNTEIEQVFKDKLLEASNGRLVLDIYSSGTIASSGEMLDALKSGIADMGPFLTPVYQGQFPYSDLFSTPGLSYGTVAETDAALRAYTEAFPDELFQTTLKLLFRECLGTQAVISAKPVSTVADFNGLTMRVTSSCKDFYGAMGIAAVSMGAGDVYEGIKLHTIEATVTGLDGYLRNKLYEVADYVTAVPCHVGESAVVINMEKFNSLPADLQQVLLDVSAEMEDIYTAFIEAQDANAYATAKAANPNLQVLEFSAEETAKMTEIANGLVEAKAAELDGLGLDGAGALEFLRSYAK